MSRAGFVLTGGRSRRMGRDKALLESRGQSLLARTAAEVRAATGSVCLAGAGERYRGLGFISLEDIEEESGPLAGIVTCLASEYAMEHNLIVAVDMPAISAGLFERLLAVLQNELPLQTVWPRTPDGRLHPLCGAWRKSALPALRVALSERRLKVLDMQHVLSFAALPVDDATLCTNLNTPFEWEAYCAAGC